MAGEEVVGGIVGFLRLDADDFHREITRAIAEVKVLKGMDAKVDVRVTGARSAERDLLKTAAAAKAVDGNVGAMNKSFSGGGGLMSPQVIIGGITAAMALLGPVTGAATAATAGFVGVLGTGILAFQGFKAEVKQGTALGMAMQDQLDGLQGALQALARTAATAMAGDVFSGMERLRNYLPSLNDDVASLAGRLGKAFNISVGGLISGLENAMPLLQDGGRYAEMLAQKFAEFTQSKDFKDFVDYARKALPDVAANLEDLVVGLGKITVALAPVGDQMVALIGFFGDMADAAAPVIGLLAQANKLTLAGIINSVEDWRGANNDAVQAVDEHATKTAVLANVQSGLATGLGTTDQALSQLEEKNRKSATTAADATLAMQLQGDAAGLLKQQLDLLNGKALGLAEAQTNSAAATLSLTKSMKDNGATLSGNTAKGIANRQAIEAKVRADQDLASAVAKSTGSTEAGTASLAKSKTQLEDTLRSQGKLTTQVQRYIDSIYKVPKSVPPTKLEVETASGLSSIRAFQKAINALHGKTVTAQVRYAYTGRLPNGGVSLKGGSTFDAGAAGGLIQNGIRRFSGGGLLTGPGTGTSDSILAQIASTGEAIRVANGEFISTAASQQRNRAALEAGNNGATLAVAGQGSRLVSLDTASVQALAVAMSRVQIRPQVSASQFDRALGGTM